MLVLTKKCFAIIALFTVTLLFGLAGIAISQSEPKFKVNVSAAVYALRVRDAQGKPIKNLAAEDFLILESGKARPIVFFREHSSDPVSVALLLDHGSAMSEKSILSGKRLIFELIHLLDHDDEILLATYDKGIDFLSRLTTDRYKLLGGIENISPGGRPSKLSVSRAPVPIPHSLAIKLGFSVNSSNTGYAIDMALLELRQASHPNKIVMVISAGSPGMGEATLDHLQEAGAHFFSVDVENRLGNLISLGADSTTRRKIVRETGGVSFSAERILDQLHDIRSALKHYYLLAYEPAAPLEGANPLEPVKVEVKIPSHPDAHIYFMRSPRF